MRRNQFRLLVSLVATPFRDEVVSYISLWLCFWFAQGFRQGADCRRTAHFWEGQAGLA